MHERGQHRFLALTDDSLEPFPPFFRHELCTTSDYVANMRSKEGLPTVAPAMKVVSSFERRAFHHTAHIRGYFELFGKEKLSLSRVECVLYGKTERCYKSAVDFYAKLRRQSVVDDDKVAEATVKIAQNAAYGRPERFSLPLVDDDDDDDALLQAVL